MAPRIYSISGSLDFAATLADGIVARCGPGPLTLAGVTVFLPTQRGVRTLSEAFVRRLGGAALLPAITALGDSGEDDALFDPSTEDLALPQPMAPLRQRLLLARLVERWAEARSQRIGFAQALSLAGGLASFLFEMQTARADLSALETIVPAALAAHWAEVRDFLLLLRDRWPDILRAEAAIDPGAYRDLALGQLRARLMAASPQGLVIAAGSTGSIPATAELLASIASLPNGAIVLPGLDRGLDEASWARLDDGHPQHGIKTLLTALGAARADAADWGEPCETPRQTLIREALRPAPTTDAWRALAATGGEGLRPALSGLCLIEAASPAEEALVIALALRETLEHPGKTAALVTPDRSLARRVAAELQRWDIAADDSAGRPLSHTPAGEFLCLIAAAAEAGFAPVPLLALLQHPLCAGGLAPGEFHQHVRALDIALRGPRPDAGLASTAERLKPPLHAWFEDLRAMLAPFEQAITAPNAALSELLRVHLACAQTLAATASLTGAEVLWRGEAGRIACDLADEILLAAEALTPIDTAAYPALIRRLIAEKTVRPAFGTHPRLAILGPLEARLQRYDVTILGGLNEGIWPRTVQSDAWLSRPMRQALGLELPERRIGRAAHDFELLCAGPRVVLTRALKAGGAPTVAARWWQRLTQLVHGLGLTDALDRGETLLGLARQADEPAHRLPPAPRPAPRPPVAVRPRTLSVTEIETWLRDPYAIYAKHILRLVPLEPLDAPLGARERGTAIHLALERFIGAFPGALPDDADAQLIETARAVFEEARLPRAAMALWLPRFARAARWFAGEERRHRAAVTRSHLEIKGRAVFAAPGGGFTLRAKADRIDELRGGGAAILDYKSGNLRPGKQVLALISPQLPLEGAILAAGGFEAIGPLEPAALIYVRFSGGADPGEFRTIEADAAQLSAEAARKLTELVTRFDAPAAPYISRVMPLTRDAQGDYDHLARLREWSLTGWEGDE